MKTIFTLSSCNDLDLLDGEGYIAEILIASFRLIF